LKGVPILSAFTGVHTDYSTPRDTAEKLDYESLAKTARLMGQVAQSASALEAPPEYVKVEADPDRSTGRSGRVYLGTIPDYSSMNEDAEGATGGVLLSGVSSNAPADRAGLEAGDVIVELAGQSIGDIYDYMRVMDNLKIGEPVSIVVLRDGERSELTITPASRE
jgi:S1-C subfamily serine protease